MHNCLGIHIALSSSSAMHNDLLCHPIRPGVPVTEVQWCNSHTIRGLDSFAVVFESRSCRDFVALMLEVGTGNRCLVRV
jgi:hypothetical protein